MPGAVSEALAPCALQAQILVMIIVVSLRVIIKLIPNLIIRWIMILGGQCSPGGTQGGAKRDPG